MSVMLSYNLLNDMEYLRLMYKPHSLPRAHLEQKSLDPGSFVASVDIVENNVYLLTLRRVRPKPRQFGQELELEQCLDWT